MSTDRPGCDSPCLTATNSEALRVIADLGKQFEVRELNGSSQRVLLPGKAQRDARADAEARPVVGDWVTCKEGRIEAILPRRTVISRKAAGERHQVQLLASNVDLAIIVMAFGGDFNARRVRRTIAGIAQPGLAWLVVINKADLADVDERQAALAELADMDALCVSVFTHEGVADVAARNAHAGTAVALGSSGVGKSSLLNCLLGSAVQEVREVRAHDERGQHTTTHRELFELPGGGCLIDSPGIREFALWQGSDPGSAFEEVRENAMQCRFRDCTHTSEPGCAVSTSLAPEALAEYHKLQRELAYAERKSDRQAWAEERSRWRSISKLARARTREKQK